MSTFFAAVNVGDSVQKGLDAFFAFVPKLVGIGASDGPAGSRRVR